MQHIHDPADPRLQDYRHLTDAAARRAIEGAAGIFIVEGILALRQLLLSTHRIRSVLVSPTRLAAVRRELDQVGARRLEGATVLVAERGIVEDVTGFDVHRGVLAAVDRPAAADPGAVLASARAVVVADGVNDHENLGALFRNAAALGLDAVLLDDAAADPLYRRSIRVSAGWAMRLPHARLGPSAGAPEVLHSHGFRTVALTPAPEAVPVDVAAARGLLQGPVALFVGSEGSGLAPEVIGACRAQVRVPMARGVDSLNVATSLAVVAAFAAASRGWG